MEFFRNAGILLSIVLLGAGTYLIYEAIFVSHPHQDSAGVLMLGATLCALGLVTALGSARTAYAIRDWKRHVHHPR